MNLVEVDDKSWEHEIELSELPVLVMFYSTTCPSCKVLEPYFTEYAQEYAGKVQFAKLNVYENQFTAERYGIMGTPTFKFFCNGKPVQELVGAAYPTLLKKLIDDTLEYGKECVEKTTPVRFDPAYV
jgi:thioredoxin 1